MNGQGPFKKKAFLKLVTHFLVKFVMELFLHNSDMLIPNLPHAKLYFVFFLPKIQNKMAAKISENVTTLRHDLLHNEHKTSSVSKIKFWGSGYSVLIFPKVI